MHDGHIQPTRHTRSSWAILRERCAAWEKPLSFFSQIVGVISIATGVLTYMHETRDRNDAHITAAWQSLARQDPVPGNSGQKWAMSVLAQNGIDMHGVHLNNVDLSGDLFADSAERVARLRGARLDWSAIVSSNFANAILARASFQNAVLEGTSFKNADLAGADFNHADLTDADLRCANLTAARFTRATLIRVRVEQACIDDPGHPPVDFPWHITRQCPATPPPADAPCGQVDAGH